MSPYLFTLNLYYAYISARYNALNSASQCGTKALLAGNSSPNSLSRPTKRQPQNNVLLSTVLMKDSSMTLFFGEAFRLITLYYLHSAVITGTATVLILIRMLFIKEMIRLQFPQENDCSVGNAY